MKKALCLILAVFLTAGCRAQGSQNEPPSDQTNETAAEEPAEVQQEEETEQEQTEMTMRMKIDDTQVEVEWQENESVQALKEIVTAGPLSIQMSPLVLAQASPIFHSSCEGKLGIALE